MLTSVRWLNDYLDPPATAEEQADLATRAGFPLEGSETVEISSGTDCRQDFEMTSNRGDCVSHVGLAREIAAISGRTLKVPAATPTTAKHPAADRITVTNHEPAACPLYTARVIAGAKVGPSPTWLADRLIARGDIPRNNVVDATNFVLFELGQPTHVFDLAKIRGPHIHIRRAKAAEPFLPLGEGETEIKLVADDLVIADAERAVALAGVKGGGLTAVTTKTTDLLLEAAAFDPVTVRNSSRRHNIASDSSYRFERGVHPGQIEHAAARLAELILEVAGGELLAGVVHDGAPLPKARSITMRPSRCRQLLGVAIDDDTMMASLARLGFEPTCKGEGAKAVITCVIPVHRLDLEREVDLIEEVGRMYGHDNIPIRETIDIRIAAPQPTEMARVALADTLVGLDFVEIVTHSLVSEAAATPFLAKGAKWLRVEDIRAKAEPVLRPSLVPSLLRVRRHNADNGLSELRLFESASTFWVEGEEHHEIEKVGLLMDAAEGDLGLRPLRGVVERLVRRLAGREARVDVTPATDIGWLTPAVRLAVGGTPIGVMGRVADGVGRQFGLDQAVVAAELMLEPFYADYPPDTQAAPLPSFPAIERDLSLVLDESAPWADVEKTILDAGPAQLEGVEFVTTFRGAQIGKGRKSLTVRLRFRADDRTLTHDEVDPEVTRVIDALQATLNAEVRR